MRAAKMRQTLGTSSRASRVACNFQKGEFAPFLAASKKLETCERIYRKTCLNTLRQLCTRYCVKSRRARSPRMGTIRIGGKVILFFVKKNSAIVVRLDETNEK